METAVSARELELRVLDAGDPTVSGPSLSSASDTSVLLTAGVGAPRDFMAPHTCDGLVLLRLQRSLLSTTGTLAKAGKYV
jgi:hypothetical protein